MCFKDIVSAIGRILYYWFARCRPLVCPKLCSHREAIDAEAVRDASKTAQATE